MDGKTSAAADIAVNAGEYIAEIASTHEDVLIEIVTDVVAEGDVYDINGAITVTYEGDKPAVEQAIKRIVKEYLPGKGLHDIEMVNVWNNVYYFEGTDIYGNVHSYTWNSVRDFVPGVDVTVNDVTKTVAYDASLTEAAQVDGATKLQTFWKIMWPQITPTTLYILVITTINSFQCFALIQLLTSGGPNHATDTIMYYIYYQAFKLYQYGYGNAMGVILAIIIALLSALQFKVAGKGND